MKEVFDEKNQCWRDEYGRRLCTTDLETLQVVTENCKEFLLKRNTIYLHDIVLLLGKSLEFIKDKNDLSPSEKDDIKTIRSYIKGL